MQESRRQIYPVPGAQLGMLTLVPGGVAYTVEASNGGHRIVLLDLASGATRVIASTPAGGLFNGAGPAATG